LDPFADWKGHAALVAEERFEGDLSDWALEGNADWGIRDGRLRVDALPDRYATIWWRQDLPADCLIEYRAHVLPPGGDGNNVNTFLYATGPAGEDVLALGLTGRYQDYHDIPNYIVTLTSTYSRLRRCPGFVELSERLDVHSEPGKTYDVRILKVGGRIQAAFNDRVWHDVTDPAPHVRGRLALRAWHGANEYHFVRLWAIET
jgi:hypothetical protein